MRLSFNVREYALISSGTVAYHDKYLASLYKILKFHVPVDEIDLRIDGEPVNFDSVTPTNWRIKVLYLTYYIYPTVPK